MRKLFAAIAAFACGVSLAVPLSAAISPPESDVITSVAADLRAQADRLDALATTTTTTLPPTTTSTVPPTTTTTAPPSGELASPFGPRAAITGPTAADSTRPASSYSGTRLTLTQVLNHLYNAGFRTALDLQVGAAIGRAESSWDIGARRWHPTFGFRTDSLSSMHLLITPPAGAKWTDSAGVTHLMRSDRGLWQISDHFYPQYTAEQCDNPAVAARIVKLIKDAKGWTEWNTYTGGQYRSLVSLADVEAFLATK